MSAHNGNHTKTSEMGSQQHREDTAALQACILYQGRGLWEHRLTSTKPHGILSALLEERERRGADPMGYRVLGEEAGHPELDGKLNHKRYHLATRTAGTHA